MLYDVIILGAGPAGLSAGIYASRAKLKTLIIEKAIEGGQITGTTEVENYPGIGEGMTGMDLSFRMADQAKSFGAEIISDEILEVDLKGSEKVLKGRDNEYRSKVVILATGANSRPMGVPGEEEFSGRGISYCATCDAAFYQDADVYVIGGGDAAVEEAMFITKFAKTVYIVHRRDELRAAKSIQEKAFANEKIKFLWDSVVEEVIGDKVVSGLKVKNVKTGEITEISQPAGLGSIGIFVFIGFLPNTELFKNQVALENGYVVTDENMKTSIDGVFAAGDLREKSVRQVVTAVSDGAIAAISAEKYIEEI